MSSGVGTLVECTVGCVASFKYVHAYNDTCMVGWSIEILICDKLCAIRRDSGELGNSHARSNWHHGLVTDWSSQPLSWSSIAAM